MFCGLLSQPSSDTFRRLDLSLAQANVGILELMGPVKVSKACKKLYD